MALDMWEGEGEGPVNLLFYLVHYSLLLFLQISIIDLVLERTVASQGRRRVYFGMTLFDLLHLNDAVQAFEVVEARAVAAGYRFPELCFGFQE